MDLSHVHPHPQIQPTNTNTHIHTCAGTPQGEADILIPPADRGETTNQIPDGNGITKSMPTRNGCFGLTSSWLQLTALLPLSVYFLEI